MESDENGDVVTLRSDGEIAATYYYDAFGNVLSKTGEADNSILYAGYQYDEETGLYYVNARMYDPVTARFLQADTYLGNINDPLSLNLYTYCLNNPDRYVDPSGHSAVLTILGFVAARVIIGLAAGIVSAGMEVFNQKVLEKRTRVNYDLVLFEGISNGIIAMTTSAVAAIGKNAAKQTAKVTARKIGRKLLQGVALGAAEGMAMDVGRQIIEGTKIKDVSFTQALGSGVTGGIFGAAGVGMEFGLDALKKTRGFVKLQSKAKTTISKGANAIKVKFAELAGGNNRGTLNWNAFKKDTVTEALEEAVEGGSNSRNILNVGAGDNPIPCATNIDINPSAAGVIFGDANDLSQFASGQFDHVIALNPYNYNLLDSDVPRVLKEGGIMSVTGNYSNKYFKSIYNASPESLKQVGFEVVSRGDAGSAFLKYGGKVTGGVRQIQGTHLQIILRKVGVQ